MNETSEASPLSNRTGGGLFQRKGLSKWVLYLSYFVLAFGRFLYFGLKYYPQLDDYLQYGLQEASPDRMGYINAMGLLKSRPLAAFLDEFVAAPLYKHLIVAVLLMTVLYALSAILFEQVFRPMFGTSPLFSLLYLLMPINFEGTYWLSASTRIVSALFFTALSAFLLQRYITTGKKRFIIPYLVSGICSVAFYEQGLVLSLTVNLLVALYHCGTFKTNKRPLLGLSAFGFCAVYFGFTAMMPKSAYYSARMMVQNPFSGSDYYFEHFFSVIFKSIGNISVKGTILTLCKGFWRGVKQIAETPHFIWLFVLLLALAAVFFFVRTDEKAPRGAWWRALVFGVLIGLAPVSFFFVVGETPWFSCRNIVCSMPGAALIADTLVQLVFRRKKLPLRIICTAFALVACIAGISETADYKSTWEDDQIVVSAAKETITEPVGTVKILNLNSGYLEDCNYSWNEHIHGSTENPAALTSMCKYAGVPIEMMLPLNTTNIYNNRQFYEGWNAKANRIQMGDIVYDFDYEKGTLTLLTIEPMEPADDGREQFMLLYPDGTPCGKVCQNEFSGYFTPAA